MLIGLIIGKRLYSPALYYVRVFGFMDLLKNVLLGLKEMVMSDEKEVKQEKNQIDVFMGMLTEALEKDIQNKNLSIELMKAISRQFDKLKKRLDKIEGRIDKPATLGGEQQSVCVDKKDLKNIKQWIKAIGAGDLFNWNTANATHWITKILNKYGI